MFPLTLPVVRRSQNGFPSVRRVGFLPDPPPQIASNMPDHADHAGRLPRSTERPALKSP